MTGEVDITGARIDELNELGRKLFWAAYPTDGQNSIKPADLDAHELSELLIAAADDIQYLRQGVAYYARVIEAQTLDLKSLSKTRHTILADTVRNMRKVAFGGRPIQSLGFHKEIDRIRDKDPNEVESWE